MEDLLNAAEAARLIPTHPHPSAVVRWCRRGIKTRGGARVYLKHLRIGKGIYLHPDDLEIFFRKIADEDQAHWRAQKNETDPDAIDKAKKRLAKSGVKSAAA